MSGADTRVKSPLQDAAVVPVRVGTVMLLYDLAKPCSMMCTLWAPVSGN